MCQSFAAEGLQDMVQYIVQPVFLSLFEEPASAAAHQASNVFTHTFTSLFVQFCPVDCEKQTHWSYSKDVINLETLEPPNVPPVALYHHDCPVIGRYMTKTLQPLSSTCSACGSARHWQAALQLPWLERKTAFLLV